jgi:hypothetical protein
MTIFLIPLVVLALIAIVATVVVISRDGYRAVPYRSPQHSWHHDS